jgi:23S rRNA pseudouridine1911/1915/1917 synthase
MANSDARIANYSAGDPVAAGVRLTIPLEMAGLRLDQALARLLPEESRSRLARLIGEGHVMVDGERAAPRQKLKSGEAVEVRLIARSLAPSLRPEAIALAVVHEDADLLVVDKPAGLVVHPGNGNWAGTLLNALLHHVPGNAELPRAGIVHRLDKETSGLLAVAKSEVARASLTRQLARRSMKRTYLALVRGRVARDGTVDKPIGRHPVQRTRMAVVAGGREALTHYRVRESLARHTLLECELETGRTHQIRVHLASIGHPLEGDPVYGGRGEPLLARQALHAWKLALAHPRDEGTMRFTAPMPADLRALLAQLRAP